MFTCLVIPHASRVCTSSLGDIQWFGEDPPNHHLKYPQTRKFNEPNSLFQPNLHLPRYNQTWFASKSPIDIPFIEVDSS